MTCRDTSKSKRWLGFLVLLVALLGACSRKTRSQETPRRYLVGLVMHLTFDDYAKSLMQAFESVLQPTEVPATRTLVVTNQNLDLGPLLLGAHYGQVALAQVDTGATGP